MNVIGVMKQFSPIIRGIRRAPAFALPRQLGLSLTFAIAFVGLVNLLTTDIWAQNSSLQFDASGDLLAQSSETPAVPIIVGQPRLQVVIPGHNASFSVVVADTFGISYQLSLIHI